MIFSGSCHEDRFADSVWRAPACGGRDHRRDGSRRCPTAASAEYRRHPRRRSRLRRSRRVRRAEHPHAAPGRHGGAGTEVDQLLRAAGLLAEPRRAADRPAADSQRHVLHARRASGARCPARQRGAGAAARRDHHCRSAQRRRLRHGHGRQVAPRTAAAVPADAPGIRLLVRSAVLARHADHGAGGQRLQDRRVLRPEAGVLGRAADEERRGHRAAGRPSHAHPALHRRSGAVHRREQGPGVLSLPRAFDAAHPAGTIARLRRSQQRRHLRRRDRGDRLEHRTGARRAAARGRGRADARAVHQR